ncbi:MAG TPA: hypothetical protein VIK81_04600 [Patescibacteria group bacterium]
MASREYLSIIPIHGNIKAVRARDLSELLKEEEKVLKKPKTDYPNFDFEAEIQRFSVATLGRKQRRALEKLQCKVNDPSKNVPASLPEAAS